MRGHTPGSVAVLYRDPQGTVHLFTGDSLFPGGPGKTRSPDDFGSLMDDLESRVFGELPDDTWVYPGHGDDTTLGRGAGERAAMAGPRLVTRLHCDYLRPRRAARPGERRVSLSAPDSASSDGRSRACRPSRPRRRSPTNAATPPSATNPAASSRPAW